MKKLIVEEVNLFRAEVRAAARSNQNRQCVPPPPTNYFLSCLLTRAYDFRLSLPTRDDIAASPIHEDVPADGTTSSYYSGQTPQQTGARRPSSPVMDDPSAELERELAGTHIGRH
jgi:hypothetical protein